MELGHHFLTKEKSQHSETDANLMAIQLIRQNLPIYFLFFIYFSEFKCSFKEKIKGYFQFFKYIVYERIR